MTQSQIDCIANRIFHKEKGWKDRNDPKVVAFFGDGDFGHQKGHKPVPKKKLVKSMAMRGCTIVLDEYNTSKWCPCGASELQDCTYCPTITNSDSGLSDADTEMEIDIKPHESCRYRCHKHNADGDKPGANDCCVRNSIGQHKMDRDTLAVMNMLLCAKNALNGMKRPSHLCRKKDQVYFTT